MTPASTSRIIGTLSGILGTFSVPPGSVVTHASGELGHEEAESGVLPGEEEMEDEDEDFYDDDDNVEQEQRRTIYASETEREFWAFELRELRFGGF